jgi:hypothetical protein
MACLFFWMPWSSGEIVKRPMSALDPHVTQMEKNLRLLTLLLMLLIAMVSPLWKIFFVAFRQEIDRIVEEGIASTNEIMPSVSASNEDARTQHEEKSRSPPSPPKVRLTIKRHGLSKYGKSTPIQSGPPSPFRIKLSAAFRLNNPIPTRSSQRARPKEDIASFVDEREVIKDDEWTPVDFQDKSFSTPKLKGKSPSQPRKVKVRDTARQRLLKRPNGKVPTHYSYFSQ